MARTITPSQTVGPFFHYALVPFDTAGVVAGEGVPGDRVVIEGRVLDGEGQPVPDAMIETWQADAAGRYDHPEDARADEMGTARFKGAARVPTDKDGSFRILTIKPGRVPGRGNALQAPHIMVSVLGRGLLKRLATRLYFADEAEANEEDAILALVPEERRGTLVARADGEGPDGRVYRFDIRLQGDDETVFFDV
jgi:protocatechuate 3,4-dioxygenase alpha subunit